MNLRAAHRAVVPLSEIDARIENTPRGALTLDPRRARATPLSEVVGALAEPAELPHLAAAAAAVAEAQLDSFPENVLWDFDYYLSSIHAQARETSSYAAHLERLMDRTVGLMRLYGQRSTIRFRYVHDFIYGFDWARWVRRDSSARKDSGPFSLRFLEQVERRGKDILTLIDEDDALYHKLSGSGSRNPFAFSRDPDDELLLYRRLAERGCIPVEAWRLDARPDASRDFDALREEVAEGLGLAR
ncbi:MAG: ferrochelatase [Deltaproteobacteria bacterium]|jgi:hypothetical protein|nr:ferrochelatase [Deltaproteobacteria bacterium]